jgi:hypothetical protein
VKHGRPHFASILSAERKKFRIFFIQSIVYLKSYINFEEIIKIKVMKTRNTTVKNIEVNNGVGYFDIDCGKGKEMQFQFTPEWILKGGELDSVTVKLSKYDFYAEDGALISSKHLNKRNTKLICEYIESVLDNDPYSFEFDEYELMQEEFDFNQEIIFEERRLSNI